MLKPIHIVRLLKINHVLLRHSLFGTAASDRLGLFKVLRYFNPYYYRNRHKPRGQVIRETLESLGPIYVKFGQLLSTRQDLIAKDIIQELCKLQDNVPPFDGHVARRVIERELGQPIDTLFETFADTPLASASVAQVHAATLHSGESVVVKVIRPTIHRTIKQDIAVLELAASLTERCWKHGKRLRAQAVVAEFAQTLENELDLQNEAANAALLRRNFATSNSMYVPQVYWDYITRHILVMERVYGTPFNQILAADNEHLNYKKLAEHGVEIFFTQVFRDGFFHADMHPGNLFIDDKNPDNPRYIGVDFGIMGTLNPEDQHYLALNMLAFFNRDYQRVATLHVESGWVSPNTRIDQFESAIRAVCEPIFERPIADISFGKLLLRLFQTAERFDMEVQPQLILLQKTLFNIESLGRQLYPTLNLWDTAKPFLTKWLKQQRGFSSLAKLGRDELHDSIEALIKTPQLLHKVLSKLNSDQTNKPAPRPRSTMTLIYGVILMTVSAQQWWLHQSISILLITTAMVGSLLTVSYFKSKQ